MTGLAAGIDAKAVFSAAGARLGKVPRWAWIALIVAVALVGGFLWHQHVAHKAIAAAEKRGADAAYASIQRQADALKAKTDALATKIRSKTDENARHIADRADDLRLRGPGKAACAGPIAAPAGGHDAAGRPVDGGLSDLSGEQREPLVGLPYGEVVDFAEIADLNRNEVLAWREWYQKISEAWPKPAPSKP